MIENTINDLLKKIIIVAVDDSSEWYRIVFKTPVWQTNRISTPKNLSKIQFIFTLFVPILHEKLASFDEIIEKEIKNTEKSSQYCPWTC
jgi:hypothetical protein